MQCEYIYPDGTNYYPRCKRQIKPPDPNYCNRHTPKRLYEVIFHDFLEIYDIDPDKIPSTLYDVVFDDLKIYVINFDVISIEKLRNNISMYLIGLQWDQLDYDQNELNPWSF